MKRTALIIAGLMALGSTSAFAEGGAERMRYYFESLRLAQQQALGQASQTNELRVPSDQTAQVTETYRPK
ncbi:hypothetical protein [Pseudomonas vancouverensis]|uniref:DUF3613 domain-containing protein n=1 Tax=Pseudomonas vancouverensis TaxID=95300 RepID=A0A1H2ND66_PSEVA|nr:hypothetical protein [Pseudomonas vancouverensis]KAB0494197.1 hypothetical protein F7R09_20720 [Pseudomonas vancouverensis]TDB60505.1 hypothetical protein EIY72_16820 [Pseudomonas vancouverensis]SDV03314.1 hypothetical protein SAMN05216558_2061 [Pseudomonas vancouverensis]